MIATTPSRALSLALRLGTVLIGMGVLLPLDAAAQRREPEFTRQGLLVPGFMVGPGVDPRAARRAGDDARSAVKDRVNGREVEVIAATLIETTMERAGYRPNDAWLESDIRALGEHVRADEYLVGRVADEGKGAREARVGGELVLMRDPRMRQRLPDVTAPDLDDAAKQLGHHLAAARAQLVPLRRCENALRSGNPAAAVRAARAGADADRRGTLVRACLAWALRASSASHESVLDVGRQILAVDSMHFHGLETAATALDSLGRHAESAPLWVRLAATDTANVELADRVLYALHEGGSLEAAEQLVLGVRARHPDHLPFARHQWRIAYDRQSWPVAIAAGEFLAARDTLAQADPVFHRRFATAYRVLGRPYEAVEIVARGVARFPEDARLYALYGQYVMAEADTVLPRGLALFPRNGELLALQAQRRRAGGDLAGAVEAMRLALASDSTIPDAALVLAQAEMELGRPDSALVSLRRALAAGIDSARIAQFAFARGNALFRAAQGTKTAGDFGLSLRFLALADSVRPTSQTRLVVGMAALSMAQAAFTEAVVQPDTARRCTIAQEATALLPLARQSLEAGREVSAEVVDQGLAYLGQLEPYSADAMKQLCRP